MKIPIVMTSLLAFVTSSSASSPCQQQYLDQVNQAVIDDVQSLAGSTGTRDIWEYLLEEISERLACSANSSNPPCHLCYANETDFGGRMWSNASEADAGDVGRMSAVLLLTVADMTSLCNDSFPHNATYESFLDDRLHSLEAGDHEDHEDHEDGDEDEVVTQDTVEHLLEVINATLNLGPHDEHDDEEEEHSDEEEEHSAHCSQTLSGDAVYDMFADEDHGGVERSRLEAMLAHVAVKILQGYCVHTKEHTPTPYDYSYALFAELAANSTSCNILGEDVEKMAVSIGIPLEDEDHDEGQTGEHEGQTDEHGHEHRRKRRQAGHTDDEGLAHTCLSAHGVLEAFNLDDDSNVTLADFQLISTALIQQAVQGCVHSESKEEKSNVSDDEVYGYGILAVSIISLFSVFGLVIYKWHESSAYHYLLSAMLGLSVATLVGDSLLHLIPHGVGLHDHGAEDAHNHSQSGGIVVEPFVWKMLAICGSIWAFFNLQIALQHLQQRQAKVESTAGQCANSAHNCQMSEPEVQVVSEIPEIANGDAEKTTHVNQKLSNNTSVSNGVVPTDAKKDRIIYENAPQAIAWMVVIGDAVHNFADGLAIGAAFAAGTNSGLSTSIAVFLHELPHEFGDVAMLLATGWSPCKVAVFQLLSAATAFIGLFVGVGLSEITNASSWIFVVAAGMFLYVALSDVIPELLRLFTTYNKLYIFLTANLGIFVGFVAMTLIAVYEEQIEI